MCATAVITNVVNVLTYSDINTSYHQDNKALNVYNLDAINNQVVNILTTPIGERPFEPEFGSILPTLLFEPISDVTSWSIETEIFEALGRWQPRIRIIQSQTRAIPDPKNASYLLFIAYTTLYNATNTVLTIRISP